MRWTLLLALGCSDYGMGTKSNADGEPDIAVDPPALEFGEVAAGETATLPLVVSNRGTALLYVESTTLDAPDSFTLVGGLTTDAIEVGASATLEVAWSPMQTWETGTLDIRSDDPASPLVQVGIEGFGIVTTLSVIPDPVEFASGEDGCLDEEQVVTFENVGNAPLEVESVAAVGESYELVSADSMLGTYAPGDARDLVIVRTGSGNGELWVASNDPRGDVVVGLEEPSISSVDLDGSEDIDLETTWLGCPTTHTLRFDRVNDCEAGEVTLESITLEGEGFSLAFPESVPYTWASGESIEIVILVEADTTGVHEATMFIQFGDDPLVEVSLSTTVEDLEFQVTPDPIDFGDWPGECLVSEPVEVTNPSPCPMTVDSIELSRGDQGFEITDAPRLPATLDQWETLEFDVEITTPGTGSRS